MLSLFRRFSTADTRLCRADRRWQSPGIKESCIPNLPKLSKKVEKLLYVKVFTEVDERISVQLRTATRFLSQSTRKQKAFSGGRRWILRSKRRMRRRQCFLLSFTWRLRQGNVLSRKTYTSSTASGPPSPAGEGK